MIHTEINKDSLVKISMRKAVIIIILVFIAKVTLYDSYRLKNKVKRVPAAQIQ